MYIRYELNALTGMPVINFVHFVYVPRLTSEQAWHAQYDAIHSRVPYMQRVWGEGYSEPVNESPQVCSSPRTTLRL